MIDHYNAFISYRHAPKDIKVAEQIERDLEHFHIPKSIRKKTGIGKIQRIFRDKDELPITSDLGDQISYALDHSDFLIVICSTSTKESVWVQREIEYFLTSHTRNQILTVLVDGEPAEVIPEILLSEERVITDESGIARKYTVALEPLSCDYRSGSRRARRDELPRLASTLLGCSYDELMNRRRQYKMRRLSIIFASVLAVSIAFSVYMIRSQQAIKRNYIQSLANRSRYLSSESNRLLENEQRISALQLALAALPDEEHPDIPVTPEAIRALTDATLSYVPLTGSNIQAEWNYTMPGAIDDYDIAANGRMLAAMSSFNTIRVWDTDTKEELFAPPPYAYNIFGIKFSDSTHLLVWTSTSVLCYTPADGNTAWEYVLSDCNFQSEDPILFSDGNVGFVTDKKSLLILDAQTGKVVSDTTLTSSEEIPYSNFFQLCASPDESKIAFVVFDANAAEIAGYFDVKSGAISYLPADTTWIRDIAWMDDSHLLLAKYKNDEFSSYGLGDQDVLSTDVTVLQCYELSSPSPLWESRFTSDEIVIESGFAFYGDALWYYCGNIIEMLDKKTGQPLHRYNTNDSIVDVSDRDGNGSPSIITENGGLSFTLDISDTDAVSMSHLFTGNLRSAVINDGVYVYPFGSAEIIYYGLYVCDEDWVEIDSSFVFDGGLDVLYTDDKISLISSNRNGTPALVLADLRNEEFVLHEISIPKDLPEYSQIHALETIDDTLYLLLDDYTKMTLCSLDINTRELTMIQELPTSFAPSQPASMSNGKICYQEMIGDDPYLTILDPKTGETKQFSIGEASKNSLLDPYYAGDINCIYYSSGIDEIIDTKTGNITVVNLPDSWGSTGLITSQPKKKLFAVSDRSNVALIGSDGNTIASVDSAGSYVNGLFFYDNTLLVTYDNGSLFRYDIADLTFIDKTAYTPTMLLNGNITFLRDKKHPYLYLSNDGYMRIIDTNSWYEVASFENCLGYTATTDRFLSCFYKSSDDNRIGYFKHYSTADLIKKGLNALQGAELTDEQKKEYGLDDD